MSWKGNSYWDVVWVNCLIQGITFCDWGNKWFEHTKWWNILIWRQYGIYICKLNTFLLTQKRNHYLQHSTILLEDLSLGSHYGIIIPFFLSILFLLHCFYSMTYYNKELTYTQWVFPALTHSGTKLWDSFPSLRHQVLRLFSITSATSSEILFSYYG